jgi:hypothetical protein
MEISQKESESPTNEEKYYSKDQSHRKCLKGEQAQTLAQLQELHPSKEERLKTSKRPMNSTKSHEVERSLDKRNRKFSLKFSTSGKSKMYHLALPSDKSCWRCFGLARLAIFSSFIQHVVLT